MRKFEIIGEATKTSSNKFTDKYSDILWEEMTGFKNVSINDYLKVNLNN